MSDLSRRRLLKTSVVGLAGAAAVGAGSLAAAQSTAATPSGVPTSGPVASRFNIHQSVARWCYSHMSLDDLCRNAAEMGCKAIDLLNPNEWDVPRKYGLVTAMAYAGDSDLYVGLNRKENHAKIVGALTANIPLAAKAGVVNVICFPGARRGMPDDQGADNTILALNQLKKVAEDHGVTICMELLNSKIDHPDYMADHTAWGVNVVRAVNSPRVKLLYDIYHMQIMEGDLVRTIQTNIDWIGHFHTGGVPHRHELDGTQEVRWDGVMRGIVASGFKGYVAHEFIPTRDPMTSLREAVALCDV